MLNLKQNKKWDFWIDRGGTFTDIVARDPIGNIFTDKMLSENKQLYKDAGMAGIKRFLKVSLDAKIPTDVMKIKTMIAVNRYAFNDLGISERQL